MNKRIDHGVLVVGHGSRRREANQDVRKVTELIRQRGGFPLVEAAFLEIESPDIRSGFNRLVERGAASITVHPYFLSPGRHTRGDLPRQVAEAAASHAGFDYRITEPLAAHRFVVEASVERITETITTGAKRRGPKSGNNLSGRPIEKGKVYLVGAGPGDPGLLTLRARDLLTTSDIVLYDYLINPEILRLVPPTAELIYVGKVGHGQQTWQSRINALLLESACRGERVVRLKGGDPFVFGRGGEEAEALADAGVSFEIVPGISSALAAAAYAGIPVTHRGVSSSFTVQTGVRAGGLIDVNDRTDTLVILMGLSNLRALAERLIEEGRPAGTPVAVIQWATYRNQSTVVAPLDSIADAVEAAGSEPPAVIVVGEVVALREKLKWFAAEAVASNVGSQGIRLSKKNISKEGL